jgi:succinate dehydrogenase/fumarate reductase flavoprotein subunit
LGGLQNHQQQLGLHDGHTLAYDAGADLIDMEFGTVHPTGMASECDGNFGDRGNAVKVILTNMRVAVLCSMRFRKIIAIKQPAEEEAGVIVRAAKMRGGPEFPTAIMSGLHVREIKEGRGATAAFISIFDQTKAAEWPNTLSANCRA